MIVSIIRIEIRCDLLGLPNRSVFSLSTETTKENCIEGVKRWTVLYHSCEFPRSDHHRQILLVGVSFGSRVGYSRIAEVGECMGIREPLSSEPSVLYLFILCI